MERIKRFHLIYKCLLGGILLILVACNSPAPEAAEETTSEPTTAAPAEDVAVPTLAEVAALPDTPTPAPTLPPPATYTPIPTSTAAPATNTPVPLTPTETPLPTNTFAPTATNTAVPQPTSPPAPAATQAPPQPTVDPNPTLGVNVLPNGSFEEGHYNQNGVPELQLPVGWGIQWDEGPTGFGGEVWDVWVRPETRVLSTQFLPPAEHGLFIFDGQHTVKAFKGNGAISFRLFTDVNLEPGTYVFEVNLFPDMVTSYSNGNKNWSIDPAAGEMAFIVDGPTTGWLATPAGQRLSFSHTFTVDSARSVRVGMALRGKYALATNGFFIDALTLKRIQ